MIAAKYLNELISSSCFPNHVYLNYHLSAAIHHDFALTLAHFYAICPVLRFRVCSYNMDFFPISSHQIDEACEEKITENYAVHLRALT